MLKPEAEELATVRAKADVMPRRVLKLLGKDTPTPGLVDCLDEIQFQTIFRALFILNRDASSSLRLSVNESWKKLKFS